jgi:hypothetical protein
MARKLAAIRTAGVTAPTPLRRLRAAPDVRKLDDEFTAFERYRMESSEAVPKSKIMVQVVPSPPQAGQLSPGKTWESLEKRIDELGQSIGQIADGLRTQVDAPCAVGGDSRPSSSRSAYRVLTRNPQH